MSNTNPTSSNTCPTCPSPDGGCKACDQNPSNLTGPTLSAKIEAMETAPLVHELAALAREQISAEMQKEKVEKLAAQFKQLILQVEHERKRLRAIRRAEQSVLAGLKKLDGIEARLNKGEIIDNIINEIDLCSGHITMGDTNLMRQTRP